MSATPLSILFMGTPDFAVASLERLADSRHTVCAVITQPDRKVGRHLVQSSPPVKVAALERGLRVFQPEKLDLAHFSEMRTLSPDLIVVAAYGKILRPAWLELPRFGCVNVHASLLPRWRGASPIQWAIEAGDRTSGVTLMRMAQGLDTGPMIRWAAVDIGQRETAGELHDRLAALGARVLVEGVDELAESGRLLEVPQDDALATYAPMLTKEDGRVDFFVGPARFANHVRAMTPWPGAFCETPHGALRLLAVTSIEEAHSDDEPGTVLASEGGALILAVSSGAVRVERCQRPGGAALTTRDYLNGLRASPAGEVWRGRLERRLAAPPAPHRQTEDKK